jgi:hypothetical protein
MIRNLLFLYRHKKACRRLNRIVERERNSYRCEQYRRHRKAALKGRGVL